LAAGFRTPVVAGFFVGAAGFLPADGLAVPDDFLGNELVEPLLSTGVLPGLDSLTAPVGSLAAALVFSPALSVDFAAGLALVFGVDG